MNSRKNLFFASIMMIVLATLSFAESNEVLVLFHGQTQVNREAYNFLRRTFNQMGMQARVSASQDLQSVKPGSYKAIVLMNSGVSSGLDPVFQSFIKSYPAKKELFLVNLVKGSSATTIQKFSPATSPSGVDAISAASYWSEGNDKMTYIKVHQEWIKILADFIDAR